LAFPVGQKKVYTPGSAINKRYRNKVIYGAAAGLDRMQADTRVTQLVASHLISAEDGRQQIDFIRSASDTKRQIDLEMAETITMQKFLSEAPLDELERLVLKMSSGLTFAQAIDEINKERQQQPAPVEPGAPGAEGAPVAPGQEGAAPNAAADQQAAEAGGTPYVPKFAPPPFENIQVRAGNQ
jgi:hypothetical protein